MELNNALGVLISSTASYKEVRACIESYPQEVRKMLPLSSEHFAILYHRYVREMEETDQKLDLNLVLLFIDKNQIPTESFFNEWGLTVEEKWELARRLGGVNSVNQIINYIDGEVPELIGAYIPLMIAHGSIMRYKKHPDIDLGRWLGLLEHVDYAAQRDEIVQIALKKEEIDLSGIQIGLGGQLSGKGAALMI